MKKILFSLLLMVTMTFTSKSQITLTTAVDFTAVDVNGNEVNLFEILDSGKHVVLNFWASWCGTSASVAGDLNDAYVYYGCNYHDIVFISINIENSDNDATCIVWNADYGVDYPTISGISGGDSIGVAYGVSAIPTACLIAPDHSVVDNNIWPITTLSDITSQINSYGFGEEPCVESVAANFTGNPLIITVGESVDFTDLSTGATSWAWTFVGATPSSSTSQNPTGINYNVVGTFDVILTASNDTYTDTKTKTNYITVLAPPIDLDTVLSSESCAGVHDGAIDLTAAGETSPYTFLWSNGSTTEDISGLVAGYYSVTITDIMGYPTVFEFYVSANDAIYPNLLVTNTSGAGICDGSIYTNVTGGNPPYYFNWGDASTNSFQTSLCEGIYNLTVSDENGCHTFSTIALSNINDTLLVADTLFLQLDTCIIDTSIPIDSCNITGVYFSDSVYILQWVLWQEGDCITLNFNIETEILPQVYMVEIGIACYYEEKSNYLYHFTDYFDFSTLVGLPDLKDELIKIYPNPSSGIVYINSISKEKINKIEVFDVFGKKLDYKAGDYENPVLDLSCFANGHYILKVSTGRGVVHKNLLIIK